MKVDLTQMLYEYDGKTPLKIAVGPPSEPGGPPKTEDITLRKACLEALGPQRGDENSSAEDKIKRDVLAVAIYSAPSVLDISDADRVLLKDRINRWAVSPRLVAQAHRMLSDPPAPSAAAPAPQAA